jgi:pSer/pThr/pTyr-binding forkhead associated (FHA) protein
MNAILVLILRSLLLIFAYGFIGWIIYTLYVELRQMSGQKDQSSIPPIILIANIDNASYEHRYIQTEIIIGRDPTCDLILDQETISLRHCKLFHQNKQWWTVDMNSTNGTYLNNSLVESATVLTDDDTLRLGTINILISIN